MPVVLSPSLLLADDQPDVIRALQLLFKGEGFSTQAVSSPGEMLGSLAKGNFDLAIIDLNYTRDTTSGREGLDLLSQIALLRDPPPVVVMTAWGSIELAVEAMRRGARDFIEKPWDNHRLLSIVRTQIELSLAVRRAQKLEAKLDFIRQDGDQQLIAQSTEMQSVLELIRNVSQSDATVLITGENGTGKGVVARLVHSNSPRRAESMMTIDAASYAPSVFESELFGHVKGAFTDARSDRVGRIELADGGTLFFDEIGNVPLAFQAKLLRAIETGEYEAVGSSKRRQANIRIVAATNADLSVEVEAGRFRQDLLFRLNTIEIHLPALRDRREDIVPLAEYFLSKHSGRYRKSKTGFSKPAIEALMEYQWPGNVRQLSHVIERAVLMAKDLTLSPVDLDINRQTKPADRMEDLTLEEVERILVQKAMTRCQGNVSRAADILGLSRTAMYRRLTKFGMDTSQDPRSPSSETDSPES